MTINLHKSTSFRCKDKSYRFWFHTLLVYKTSRFYTSLIYTYRHEVVSSVKLCSFRWYYTYYDNKSETVFKKGWKESKIFFFSTQQVWRYILWWPSRWHQITNRVLNIWIFRISKTIRNLVRTATRWVS